MQVLFFASIRECTKEKEIRWDEAAGTVGELLAALSARYGPAFRKWVVDGEELSGLCIISVNGRDARHLDGAKTRLDGGDTVSIFPAIAGGRAPLTAETQRETLTSGFPISSPHRDGTRRGTRRG